MRVLFCFVFLSLQLMELVCHAGNAWYRGMPSHSASVVLGKPGVDTWAHP